MLGKLDTVFCHVTDMERAAQFYSRILGIEPIFYSENWTSFKVGDMQLGLHAGVPDSGAWIPCFETHDLGRLRSWLAEAEAWVADEFHQTPRGAILNFRDPDGNPIQAIQIGSKVDELR